MRKKKLWGEILLFVGCLFVAAGVAAMVLPLIPNPQLQMALESFSNPTGGFFAVAMGAIARFCVARCYFVILAGAAMMVGGLLLLRKLRYDSESEDDLSVGESDEQLTKLRDARSPLRNQSAPDEVASVAAVAGKEAPEPLPSDERVVCPACGARNSARLHFCRQCGRALSESARLVEKLKDAPVADAFEAYKPPAREEKAPEPLVAKMPEKEPAPLAAQEPAPVVAEAPEPVVAKAPEPLAAKAPEPLAAPEPMKVPEKVPEPVAAPEPAAAPLKHRSFHRPRLDGTPEEPAAPETHAPQAIAEPGTRRRRVAREETASPVATVAPVESAAELPRAATIWPPASPAPAAPLAAEASAGEPAGERVQPQRLSPRIVSTVRRRD